MDTRLLRFRGKLVPKKGLEPQSFGNSFCLNSMATSTEYNKLADCATQSVDSSTSSDSMKISQSQQRLRAGQVLCLCGPGRREVSCVWSCEWFSYDPQTQSNFLGRTGSERFPIQASCCLRYRRIP